jgi:hypothetical protein
MLHLHLILSDTFGCVLYVSVCGQKFLHNIYTGGAVLPFNCGNYLNYIINCGKYLNYIINCGKYLNYIINCGKYLNYYCR